MKDNIGRILTEKARSWGATDLRIEHGGKHPRLVGRLDASEFVFAFPSTPGDRRSWRNCVSQLRRKLGARPQPSLPSSSSGKGARKPAPEHYPTTMPTPLHEPGADLFYAPLAGLLSAMQAQRRAMAFQTDGEGG